MNKSNQDHEIDLLELLANGYRAVKRNLLAAIILPIAGAVTAVAVTATADHPIQSNMLIVTDLISFNECEFLFKQLEEADTFPGLSAQQRAKVSKLRYQVERSKDGDDIFLQVTARVLDQRVFPVLEDLVVAYLNQSEPVQKERSNRERIYRQRLRQIDLEMEGLNEIKRRQIEGRGAGTYMSATDVFETSLELTEKRTKAEIALEESKSVRIVKGFDSLKKDAQISIVLAAAIGAAAGIVIFVALLLLSFFIQYVKSTERA